MSGGLLTLDLIGSEQKVEWGSMALGMVLSFVAAYLCIHFFLQFIERIGMLPFVLYRLLLGGAILYWLL
jgi:undecaprenyl-diphosphatase